MAPLLPALAAQAQSVKDHILARFDIQPMDIPARVETARFGQRFQFRRELIHEGQEHRPMRRIQLGSGGLGHLRRVAPLCVTDYHR